MRFFENGCHGGDGKFLLEMGGSQDGGDGKLLKTFYIVGRGVLTLFYEDPPPTILPTSPLPLFQNLYTPHALFSLSPPTHTATILCLVSLAELVISPH